MSHVNNLKRFFFLSKRKINEGAKRTDSSDMSEECLEAFLFATKVLRRNIYLHQRCHFLCFSIQRSRRFSPPPPIRYRQNFCLTAIRRMMLIRTFRLIARESIRRVISRTPCAANDHCYRRISYMNHCESRRMIFCESLLREPPDE